MGMIHTMRLRHVPITTPPGRSFREDLITCARIRFPLRGSDHLCATSVRLCEDLRGLCEDPRGSARTLRGSARALRGSARLCEGSARLCEGSARAPRGSARAPPELCEALRGLRKGRTRLHKISLRTSIGIFTVGQIIAEGSN